MRLSHATVPRKPRPLSRRWYFGGASFRDVASSAPPASTAICARGAKRARPRITRPGAASGGQCAGEVVHSEGLRDFGDGRRGLGITRLRLVSVVFDQQAAGARAQLLHALLARAEHHLELPVLPAEVILARALLHERALQFRVLLLQVGVLGDLHLLLHSLPFVLEPDHDLALREPENLSDLLAPRFGGQWVQ